MKQPSRLGAGFTFALTAALPLAPLALLSLSPREPTPRSIWFGLLTFPLATGLAGALAAALLVRLGRVGATFGGAMLSVCVAVPVHIASILVDIKGPDYIQQLHLAISKTLVYGFLIAIPFLVVQGVTGALAGYAVAVDGGAPPEVASSEKARLARTPRVERRARAEPRQTPWRYLLNLWRGEQPLPVTYWLWGVVVVTSSPLALGFFGSKFLLFLFLPYPLLITIAIWRSAGNYGGLQWLASFARLSSMMATAIIYSMFLMLGGADLLVRELDRLR